MGWIKLAIGLAIILAVGGTIFAGYTYVENLQAKVATLQDNNAKLKASLAQQELTIGAQREALVKWEDRDKEMQETMKQMAAVQTKATEQMRRLNDVLSKHDLDRLSLAKPRLVENRINRATADVFSVFERITAGSPDGGRESKPAAAGDGDPRPATPKPDSSSLEGTDGGDLAPGTRLGVLWPDYQGVRTPGPEYGRITALDRGSEVETPLLQGAG